MAKKAAVEESTALETQGTTEMAAFDYGDDSGRGFENQTSQDVSVPFIVLLQSISPVVAEQKVAGAQAGMWMNTVTNQLWGNPQGLLFVPGTTRHEFAEFIPRKIGGGYVGRHAIDSEVVAKAKAESKKFGSYFVDTEDRAGYGKDGEHLGNELTEMFYVFGAFCDDHEPLGMAVLGFKGTMIRTYKNWMSQIRQVKGKPPLFAHLARFTTEGKKNNEGFFHVPVYTPANGSVISSLLAPDDPRFLAGKECMEMINSGAAKVNYEQSANPDSEDSGKPPF